MSEPQQGHLEGGGTLQGRQNGSRSRSEAAADLEPTTDVERFSIVVIGGGHAGLAAAYDLAQRGVDFVILERGSRLGENWRPRWDPRRVFTHARYDGLPGLPFNSGKRTYPTKDQIADYLEKYAERFGLPVRLGITVLGVKVSDRGQFLVECANGRVLADEVIVATGVQAAVRGPARDAAPGTSRLRAGDYRSVSQLEAGGVVVLGNRQLRPADRTSTSPGCCAGDTGEP